MDKREELKITVIRSLDTKKEYVELSHNEKPIKYWAKEDMSPAAIDFISELIKGYDAGYDIKTMFPKRERKSIEIIPEERKLYNEPGTTKKKKVTENYFKE